MDKFTRALFVSQTLAAKEALLEICEAAKQDMKPVFDSYDVFDKAMTRCHAKLESAETLGGTEEYISDLVKAYNDHVTNMQEMFDPQPNTKKYGISKWEISGLLNGKCFIFPHSIGAGAFERHVTARFYPQWDFSVNLDAMDPSPSSSEPKVITIEANMPVRTKGWRLPLGVLFRKIELDDKTLPPYWWSDTNVWTDILVDDEKNCLISHDIETLKGHYIERKVYAVCASFGLEDEWTPTPLQFPCNVQNLFTLESVLAAFPYHVSAHHKHICLFNIQESVSKIIGKPATVFGEMLIMNCSPFYPNAHVSTVVYQWDVQSWIHSMVTQLVTIAASIGSKMYFLTDEPNQCPFPASKFETDMFEIVSQSIMNHN